VLYQDEGGSNLKPEGEDGKYLETPYLKPKKKGGKRYIMISGQDRRGTRIRLETCDVSLPNKSPIYLAGRMVSASKNSFAGAKGKKGVLTQVRLGKKGSRKP